MKTIVTLLTLLTLTGIYGCNRSEKPGNEDQTIQREEEIKRDDIIERRSLPSETHSGDEIQIDRNVIDEDELELDE